jgi:deazaflavin-dependent oxidoreductase (nitroreductase family)
LNTATGYRLGLRHAALTEASERWLRRLARGRFGSLDLVGLPNARLTVRGRRTGIPRTVTVQYIRDGDRYLVVGSNWARAVHPVWSENLMATDEVVIQTKGARLQATSRLLTGSDRERAWQQIITAWPN